MRTLDLKSRNHRIQGVLEPIKPLAEQNFNATSAETVTDLENYWPHGSPPRAPRNFSYRSGLPSNRGQSNAKERYQPLVGNSLTWTRMQRPSSPIRLNSEDDDDEFTIRLSKKAFNKVECSPVPAQVIGLTPSTSGFIQKRSGAGNLANTTHRCQTSRTRSSPEAPCYGNSNPSEYPATSRERSHTSPSVSAPARKVAEVVRSSYRSVSAASVISAFSSIAATSSVSSVSTNLDREICHKCKRAPSTRKLKGCFECTRYYHSRCAEPPDR
jgi:hypothetical protein